jgi:two-component system nitrate/nitrite response regulator NarL
VAIRVLVADDHPVYRQGLVQTISERSEFELVGETEDGKAALERIRELGPDVVLLDLQLPELDGIGVLKALRDEGIEARVLILSAYAEGGLIYEALENGAAGYLTKGAGAEEICGAVLGAAAGERVLSPGLEGRLVSQIGNRSAEDNSALSAREAEILTLMADGLSIADICDQLHISDGTVRTYLRRAYEKLGVSTRPAAIAEAMRRGILS